MLFNCRHKLYVFSILLVLFAISCGKKEFDIENLNKGQILSFGHGGMGISSTYPLDSQEAILNCLNLGASGSEMDVQMTRDGVLVAFHDYDLTDKTSLNGLVHQKDWADIKDGFYTSPKYAQYSIMRLDHLFSGLDNPSQYYFTFDCKLYPAEVSTDQYYDDYSDALIHLMDAYGIGERVFIESNNTEFLVLLNQKRQQLKTFIYRDSPDVAQQLAKTLNFYGITISAKNISKEQILSLHNDGLFVAIWNIQSRKENIEAIEKNPDFIQTDRLKSLLRLLD